MNNIQTNKLNMYNATESFIVSNLSKLKSNSSIFTDIVNDFNGNLNAIKTESKKQGQTVHGITVDKAHAKEQLSILVTTFCGALMAYGSRKGLNELCEKIRFKKSDIDSAKDADAINRAKIVYDQAINIQADLADYNISAAKLTAFADAIKLYESLNGKRSSSTAIHTASTQTLGKLFRNMDNVLKTQLDMQMQMFRNEDPQLFAEYLKVRQIIDLCSRSRPKINDAVQQ